MQRWVRSRDQETAPSGDGAVVMSTVEGTAFALDPVGACVWDALAEARTVDDIATAVAQDFDVEPAACRDDVARLIAELETRRLVVPVPLATVADERSRR